MFYSIEIKKAAFFIFTFLTLSFFSQKTYYGEESVKWADYAYVAIPSQSVLEKYSTADLLIVNDETEFDFYASNNEKIIRNITFKINSEKGLGILNTYKLPESFDEAYDAHYFKQGRSARIKTPFIQEYTLNKFSARKFTKNKWTVVPFELKYEKIRWVNSSGDFAGEFINEDLNAFHFQGLAVGDLVQVVYEASFNSDYGDNLFYFNSSYPKVHCEYTFNYKMDKRLSGFAFIFHSGIKDTCIQKSRTEDKDHAIITQRITMDDLKGINYPANSFEGNKLPHVFADFRLYRTLNGSYPTEGGRIYDFGYVRPRNFEWLILADTTNYYTKVYDKQFSAIRKFMEKMPPVLGPDSTNLSFFKALCDTFNNFRYLSSNHLFYNEQNLKDVYSGDHLAKRRLVEHLQWKLYRDILNDNKVFYNVVNVQDRRFAEHSTYYRASYAYECNLIAMPFKNSYIYFMPRYHGMKYHLNELPFYLEGVLALLNPRNFQESMKDKDKNFFKFIKTHKGTFNENTKTENASIRISLDSLKADLVIKESLSGQFSTVLRHIYLNEAIDSTVSKHYFKKCTDKPLSSEVKTKLSSKMTEFPFRYNFNCNERITLPSSKTLNLKNWFSFPLTKTVLPETPNHDYYFDFDFSDSYNFLLNFTTPVVVSNAASFTRNINNDYFELISDITANSETSYLLKVKLAVKQISIPADKAHLLMELVAELEALNDFSLELQKK